MEIRGKVTYLILMTFARRNELQSKGNCLIDWDINTLPFAIAIWSLDRRLWSLNTQVVEMIGFTEEELKSDPTLWITCVDSRDRDLISQAWKRLGSEVKRVTISYRFSPSKFDRPIWLREESVLYEGETGEPPRVVSTYADISDVKAGDSQKHRDVSENPGLGFEKILKSLVHDIQNNLQAIRMEIDLLQLNSSVTIDLKRIFHAIDRANLSIQDLSDYFTPPQLLLSEEKPDIILEEIVEEMQKELTRQGIQVHMYSQSPLPVVSVDSRQFRNALERILAFCQALLSEGGDLEIEVDLKEIEGRRYVELRFTSSSLNSLEMDEKEVFHPFLRVHNYRAGLGMALANEILKRHHGKIYFQKVNAKRWVFTILLEAR